MKTSFINIEYLQKSNNPIEVISISIENNKPKNYFINLNQITTFGEVTFSSFDSRKSKSLFEIKMADGSHFILSCEFGKKLEQYLLGNIANL